MYGSLSFRMIVGSAHYPSREKPWVARLTDISARWGFEREFIKGVYDYTYSSKGTGKNTYMYFALPHGVYEVYAPISWKHEERYFARVTEDGEVLRMTKEEVCACLTNTI